MATNPHSQRPRTDRETETEIPHALAAALRAAAPGLDGADRAALDEAVLEMARERLGRRRGTGSGVLFRIGLPLAAAAGLAMAVWVAWPNGGTRAGSQVAVFDANKPGGVTILDAFTLARLLKQRQSGAGADSSLSRTWDINDDRTIDQRDVDAIALRAVRLSAAGSEARVGGAS